MNYSVFIKDLDKKLQQYCELHKEYICCCKGCSSCCEKGDYPISQVELEYLMQGFMNLPNDIKIIVQDNIKHIQRGGVCPFLIEKKCSVYKYRPIICRVHGLAYLYKDGVVKVPYCVNNGKNYTNIYKNGNITINPVKENLDTQNLLKEIDSGEIRNLIDWIIC